MLLKENKDKYFPALSLLWQEVFGDSEKYISLLFKDEYKGFDIFAEIDGDKVLSSLYLLSCEIAFGGKAYKGKYLYAAATSHDYRKRGLMKNLINEAKAYCEKEKLDFICLVPANEKLYGYYERFGFITAMYRYVLKCDNVSLVKFPKAFGENHFSFSDKEFNYAKYCLNFSNSIKLIMNAPYITFDEEEKKLYSPYDLSSLGECKKEKYGMIYPINTDLINYKWSFNDIYMNLALD